MSTHVRETFQHPSVLMLSGSVTASSIVRLEMMSSIAPGQVHFTFYLNTLIKIYPGSSIEFGLFVEMLDRKEVS